MAAAFNEKQAARKHFHAQANNVPLTVKLQCTGVKPHV